MRHRVESLERDNRDNHHDKRHGGGSRGRDERDDDYEARGGSRSGGGRGGGNDGLRQRVESLERDQNDNHLDNRYGGDAVVPYGGGSSAGLPPPEMMGGGGRHDLNDLLQEVSFSIL